MPATLSTVEPLRTRAGDTWRWVRSLSDYPATDWALTYTLFATGKASLSVTSIPSGTDHLIELSAAETADFAAGDYDWIATVTDGVERYPVGSGRLTILPDLAALEGVDGRSHARRMLAALEAILESRATTAELDLIRSAFADMAADRNPALLHQARARYAAEVAAEDRALARERGETPVTYVQMRF